MTDGLECAVYFADPNCSWQRGLNENTHGLLRQYWPKSTDFKKISQSEVQDVIVKINDRPRKKLKYKTPAKLMAEHMAAKAAQRLCNSELNLPYLLNYKNGIYQ